MTTLSLHLNNVHHLSNLSLDLPLTNGITCLAGANGMGKSTVLSCLSQCIRQSALDNFAPYAAADSTVSISCKNVTLGWHYDEATAKWLPDNDGQGKENMLRGFFEGSLFYGTRFQDAPWRVIKETTKFKELDVTEADEFIKDNLSEILYQDSNHFRNLIRVRNMNIARAHGLKTTPYFDVHQGVRVSQYAMSSGECMLLGLLNFIYNFYVRRLNVMRSKKVLLDDQELIIIDELEVALHPSAISRLYKFIKKLTDRYPSLSVIISTHSPVLLRNVPPERIVMLKDYNQQSRTVRVISPCFPNYAVRNVNSGMDKPDFILLVEDWRAYEFVRETLRRNSIADHSEFQVLPAGGWQNVLTLHEQLKDQRSFGSGTRVYSILDGDVAQELDKQDDAGNIEKMGNVPASLRTEVLLLPIPSLEKYLREHVLLSPDYPLIEELDRQVFRIRHLQEILNELSTGQRSEFIENKNGKDFYDFLYGTVKRQNEFRDSEISFTSALCRAIYDFSDREDRADLKELKEALNQKLLEQLGKSV